MINLRRVLLLIVFSLFSYALFAILYVLILILGEKVYPIDKFIGSMIFNFIVPVLLFSTYMISGYFLARKYYFYSRIWVTVYSAISFATVFLLFSIEIVSEKMIYKYFAYFCYYAPVFGVYGGWYFGKHSLNRTPTY